MVVQIHFFKEEQEGKTIMINELHFTSKYGILGKLIDNLILKRHIKRILIDRNEIFKQKAEELSKR